MSHSFSTATLLKFENRFDKHLNRLLGNINQTAGSVFDLKEYVARYAYDVISDLAFEKDLNTQSDPTANELPPIPDHILIGTMYGMVPSLLPYSMQLGNRLPIPRLQKLIASRKQLLQRASEYVSTAIENHNTGNQETLLDNLLEARNTATGETLTPGEVTSEAFAFLYIVLKRSTELSAWLTIEHRVAGAHTTSSTLSLLFYHLLHNRHAAEKLTHELVSQLSPFQEAGSEVAYSGLESKLPYSMACIKENFRITPVFTMPLPRLVTSPSGVDISGYHIPRDVRAISQSSI